MSSESATAPTKKWQNSKASHTKSRLLQLPAELQLIIFRELLVTEKPLGHRQIYFRPAHAAHKLRRTGRTTTNPYSTPRERPRQVQGYHLYPQVLATCQVLYDLGMKFLYAENRLVIELRFLAEHSYVSTQYTGGEVWIPALSLEVGKLANIRIGVVGLDTIDISDTAKAFTLCFDRHLLCCWRRPSATSNGPPTVFNMFGFLVLADLAPIFSRKDLIVDLASGLPGLLYGDASISQTRTAEEFESVAKVFQCLRCKAFGFKQKIGDEQIYKQIERVIKSSTPVADLREALQNVRAIVTTLFAMVPYDNARKSLVTAKFSDLQEAMYHFDVQKFQDSRKVIIEVFKEESGKLQSIAARDDEVVTQYVEAAAGITDRMDDVKFN